MGTAGEVAWLPAGCGLTYSVHCTLTFLEKHHIPHKGISIKGRGVPGSPPSHTVSFLFTGFSSGYTSGRPVTPILPILRLSRVGTNAQAPRSPVTANSKRCTIGDPRYTPPP